MDLENGLVGGGIVGALVALLWGVKKMLERSSCHSNSGCCQIDIARAVEEEMRQRTERDADRLVEMVVRSLKGGKLPYTTEPPAAW